MKKESLSFLPKTLSGGEEPIKIIKFIMKEALSFHLHESLQIYISDLETWGKEEGNYFLMDTILDDCMIPLFLAEIWFLDLDFQLLKVRFITNQSLSELAPDILNHIKEVDLLQLMECKGVPFLP